MTPTPGLVERLRARRLCAPAKTTSGIVHLESVDPDCTLAANTIEALQSRLSQAEADLAGARGCLTAIAQGDVPPSENGHYLAHRACVNAARHALRSPPANLDRKGT